MYNIKSKFVNSPCKKLTRIAGDFTNGFPVEEIMDFLKESDGPGEGAAVRLDLRVYQDEAGKVDKESIKTFLELGGAASVDIRLIRVPRVSVRAEKVLRAEWLPEKLTVLAEIRGEAISPGIIAKAEALENMNSEELISNVIGG